MSKLEYPKTLREFRQKFSTDQSCLEYLAQSRWPDGFQCPNCNGLKAWLNKNRYVYECQQCGRQTSPMAGTVMHRSKISVQEWFWSAYLVSTHTPGISAKQLQRQLGISNYETAWYLLQRLRKGILMSLYFDSTVGKLLWQHFKLCLELRLQKNQSVS